MSTEFFAERWTGRTGGLWARFAPPKGGTPCRAVIGAVWAVLGRVRAWQKSREPLRRDQCQFRVEKGQDYTQDVLCLKPVRPKHYFLCPNHYREVIADYQITDRYRYKRFKAAGWHARLRRLAGRGGWRWQWVERPDWPYWYLLKKAYTDNPAREFRA